jgi:hypothetical protein
MKEIFSDVVGKQQRRILQKFFIIASVMVEMPAFSCRVKQFLVVGVDVVYGKTEYSGTVCDKGGLPFIYADLVYLLAGSG